VLQFVGGFIVGLLAVAVLLLRKRIAGTKGDENNHLAQLEELSKLTGGLAHEIKNPLSTVKINLNLVREDLEDSIRAGTGKTIADKNVPLLERAIRKLAVVQKETDRVEQILDSFLCYIDRTELQLASININELVSDMIDFYSPQAYSRSVVIHQGLHNEPLVCKIDPDMLKQVILNLFINAQQAMSSGGELMIRTDRQENDAVIRISDTGTGIAPDKLPHIFEAYYTTRPQGRGLGLPTAKKIIKAHKGSITVNSEPGKGTSFEIRLPIQTQ
jgi:signal transduction histidine kinase